MVDSSPPAFFALNIAGREPLLKFVDELKSDKKYQVIDQLKGTALTEKIRGLGGGLLIFGIQNRSELTEFLEVVAPITSDLKSGKVRAFGCVTFSLDQVVEILRKINVTDLFSPQVTLKGLKHKYNLHKKSLLKRRERASSPDGPSAPRDSTLPIRWQAAFCEGVADCWILMRHGMIQQIQQMWSIEMIGPPPNAGRWLSEGETGKFWIWHPHEFPDDYIQRSGCWRFTGRKPTFNWRTLV